MQLPWKKAKSGRISRLMADLQQSPKRGGSLVVETGFPTSLIDLFVKNRDRLKKSSSSSNKRRRSSQPREIHTPPSPPPRRMNVFPLLPTVPAPAPPSLREEPVEWGKFLRPNTEEKEEAVGVNGDCRDSAGGSSGGCVFAAVLKVFVVVVLALSTKKLTVGITLSAFTLLLLEFTAARAFTLFKLCPDARVSLDSLIQRVLGKWQKEKLIKIDDGNVKSCEITETFEDSNNFGEEIRSPEPYTEAISCPEPESAMDTKKTRPTEEQRGETIRELMFKNERSRSSNLKSKIVKKIVPKKLRSSKKKKKSMKKEKKEDEECLSEASSVVSDDISEILEEEISERDRHNDLSNLLTPLQENSIDRESQVVEMVGKNISTEKSAWKIGSKGDNRRHLMILVVIVLSGLLCGRVLAIVLSLFWCLVLRFAGKTQNSRREMNQSDDV